MFRFYDDNNIAYNFCKYLASVAKELSNNPQQQQQHLSNYRFIWEIKKNP